MSAPTSSSVALVSLAAAFSGGAAAGLGAEPGLVVLASAVAGLGVGWLTRRGPAPPPAPTAPPRPSEHRIATSIAEWNPDAVLFFSDTGEIRFANAAARELFFEGRDPTTENFLRILAGAPAPLREALIGEQNRLVAIELEGQRETYHVTRKTLELDGELHTLLSVKHLTREIARQEVAVLKRVVRVVSHEVNNSLAPISSLVHSGRIVAKAPEPAPKLERIFATIEERADHLRAFLEGYAKVARLPAPRPREVPWRTLLGQLSALYPELELPSATGSGWFDPVQLEQVLINLVKNALEAGSPAPSVAIELDTLPGGGCDLRVLDRGQGFSDEALESALLPLYTTKEQGSGMGLALAREIVEAHGGSLSIANRRDGGACIAMHLPGPDPEPTVAGRSRLTLTRG